MSLFFFNKLIKFLLKSKYNCHFYSFLGPLLPPLRWRTGLSRSKNIASVTIWLEVDAYEKCWLNLPISGLILASMSLAERSGLSSNNSQK